MWFGMRQRTARVAWESQVTSKGGWGCDKFARFGSKAELDSLVYRLPKRQITVLPPAP